MPMPRVTLTLAFLTAAGAAIGCTGMAGSAGGKGDPGGGSGPGAGPGGPGNGGGTTPGGGGTTPGGGGSSSPGLGGIVPMAPGAIDSGVSPLRRLTSEQYRNSVRDLLGLADTVPATALPPDENIADKFTSNVVRPVQGADLDRYADVAGQLARKAIANLPMLVPCAPAQGDAGCAKNFITSFGRRAFRRPLEPIEVERLEKVYTAGGGFENGVRLVIEAVLQSPKFLYLIEPAPADASGKIVALDRWSMAARLSYFLWNSTPDDKLLEAAEKNQLASPDQVVTEAKRLMTDARFRDTIHSFHDAWMDLGALQGADKDPVAFPVWNAALKTAMGEETRRFIEFVMKEGDGKLETLLSGKFSFLSGPLYAIYGVQAPAGAAANSWAKVELPAGQRAGLLTQPGLMAALAREDRTSFVRRGKMVREGLFCQEVPPPPPGVNDSEAEIPATASAKERAEQHRRSPECASCHKLFDPIGFAFETFDAVGRFRTMDGTRPVESSLDLEGTSIDGKFANAVELAAKLGGAADVQACVAKQWLRYALGREETDADKGSLDGALKGFQQNGGDVRELLFNVVRSDAFRHQRVQ
jgi:hypothetical protein